MPRSDNAALEQGERRLDGVGVNVTVRVLAGMVDRAVLFALQLVERPRVDRGFIGHNDFYAAADVSLDDFPHGVGLGIFRVNHPQIAIALSDADDDFLYATLPPASGLAANVGFVNLYSAALKFFRLNVLHSLSDAVAEIPSRLIARVERALKLERRHSFFGFAHQVDGCKPFRQWKVRVVKDRASRNGELIAA